jgi:alpha-beta hydrolase superfamily lysophospholipase
MILRRALLGGAAALAATPARAQYYPRGIEEREARFPGADGITLAGTLALPTISEIQRVPGVVLVAGSGPTDRNGNNPLIPVKVDVLKDIAQALGRAGIATLRYDKRGIGGSAVHPRRPLDRLESFFTWDRVVGDVEAAHAELLRHDEIKPYATALLGHSEGGLLALAASVAMGKRRPYGLVLASTPGRPMGVIVREQIQRSAPELAATADRVIAAIQQTGHVPPDEPPAVKTLFPAYASTFLQAAFAFDPAAALEKTDAACLLVHGGADTQIVPLGDIQPLLDALAKRGAPGEAFVAPGVSHNLKRVEVAGDPGFAGPLAPAVSLKLVSWLAHLLGA